VLFRSGEDKTWFLQLALAGLDVHAAAFLDGDGGVRQKFFKCGQRLIVFALLQQLHGDLVLLEGRSRTCAGVAALGGRQVGVFFAA
jgi:hypothetical protein